MNALTSSPNRAASTEREDPAAEPIVAAVDASAASRAAVEEAVKLAAELEAPLVFAYVRPAPAGFFGSPLHQQRLTTKNERARHVLDRALHIANTAGVEAEAEILEGSPRQGSSSSRATAKRSWSSSAPGGADSVPASRAP
jgi:nucleotide-binding universal stress UspA family protein